MGGACSKSSSKQVRQEKFAEDQRLAREAEFAEMESRRAAEEQKLLDEQRAFEEQKVKFIEEQKVKFIEQQKEQEMEAKRQVEAARAEAEREKEEQKRLLEKQQELIDERNAEILKLKEVAAPPSPPRARTPPRDDDQEKRLEAERLHLDQERETLEIQKQSLAEEARAVALEVQNMKELTAQLRRELEEERNRSKVEKNDVMRIPSIVGLGQQSNGNDVCGFGSTSELTSDLASWSGALRHNMKACMNSFKDPNSPPEYIQYDPGAVRCFRVCGCGVEPHNRRKCVVCRRIDLADCPILQ